MNKKILLTLPLVMALLSGCGFNQTPQGGGEDNPPVIPDDPPVDPPVTPGEETKDVISYESMWDVTKEIKLSVSLSKEAAMFINEKQTNHNDSRYFDYYVPCDFNLTVGDKQIFYKDVGIRAKGNMSRDKFLDNSNNFTTSALSHFKFKFGETFDGEEYDTVNELKQFKKTYVDDAARKVVKKRTVAGMEKLNMKWNRNNDETRVKQSFINKVFIDNNVPAGHTTLSSTTIGIKNQKYINVCYELLEDIDEMFIERWFPNEPDGDLYKCAYQNAPANFSKNYTVGRQIGVEDNTKNYHPAYDLKTNKKKSTHANLLTLLQEINKDNLSATEYKTNIEKYIDMNSFLMYESIAFLGGNFDDLRNNANNYYLYFSNVTGKATIIPYDFDRCFGCGCEGRQTYMTSFSADSTKMQCNGDWQNMSIYWRSVCRPTSGRPERVESYYDTYKTNISKLLKNDLTTANFKAYVNSFPTLTRGNPDGAGKENTTYDNYITLKKNAIKSNNPDITVD